MFTIRFRAPLLRLALILATLAGCTAEPPKYRPLSPIPPGLGVVYLYKPAGPRADGLTGTVLLADRTPIARLDDGSYFPYTAKAGPAYLQLVTADPRQTLVSRGMIRIEAGGEKYLKVTKVGDRLKFTPMFPETAKAEIAGCHLREPAAAPAPAAPRPVARRVPVPAPAPVTPRGVQGLFSFEAERIAIENGCTTPTGVRPTAYLMEESESQSLYDIACTDGHRSVGCQYQFCELLDR